MCKIVDLDNVYISPRIAEQWKNQSLYVTKNMSTSDILIEWDGQLAIINFSDPRLFVRFNYADSILNSFEEWRNKIVITEFLNGNRPSEDKINAILVDCWNFLALQEAEEERRAEQRAQEEDDEDFFKQKITFSFGIN